MRKLPRQARSRATVEAIIEAGARILGEEGWADFSTNRVAELAGVSIGSLYQYFPDKVSLVDSIRDHHLQDCLAALRSVRADGATPEAFADELVRSMVALHSVFPGLHRALLDEAPRSAEHRDPNSAFETVYLAFYIDAVACFRGAPATPDDRAEALVLSDAIDGAIHNAVRRGAIGEPAMREALTRLVRLFLVDIGRG